MITDSRQLSPLHQDADTMGKGPVRLLPPVILLRIVERFPYARVQALFRETVPE